MQVNVKQVTSFNSKTLQIDDHQIPISRVACQGCAVDVKIVGHNSMIEFIVSTTNNFIGANWNTQKVIFEHMKLQNAITNSHRKSSQKKACKKELKGSEKK